jgi:hypothetical protein
VIPQPGDTVLIDYRCGAQFAGNTLTVRVTKVEHLTHTPDHMIYLAGYALDSHGIAVEHRPMLLVEHAGLELKHRPPRPRATNAGPRVPAQRARNSTAVRPVRPTDRSRR